MYRWRPDPPEAPTHKSPSVTVKYWRATACGCISSRQNGAVENVERLRDARAGVDAGFVLAGITSERESPELVSLGTMFYEPLWVFCRYSTLPSCCTNGRMRGYPIGPLGSATRPLALKLLALIGLTQRTCSCRGSRRRKGRAD